jgi:hypothetical protein
MGVFRAESGVPGSTTFGDDLKREAHSFGGVITRSSDPGAPRCRLPFWKWTQVIPKSRLCKALLDRVTDRAQISWPDRRLRAHRFTFALSFAPSGLRHSRNAMEPDAP